MKKSLIYTFILCGAFIFNSTVGFSAVQTPVKPVVKQQAKQQISYLNVSPVDVVYNPTKYLNKNVTFNAELVAFTSLGLDYKPAFRDSTKYIGVLIKRPDIQDQTIPLSEFKIFVSRELAEKLVDIDAGDIVKISGKVFSTALGDPWLDANVFTVIQQKNKQDKK